MLSLKSLPEPVKDSFSPLKKQTWLCIYVLILLFSFFIPVKFFALRIILFHVPALTKAGSEQISWFLWKKNLHIQFEFFIPHLIFHIKTGMGFRQAFKVTAQNLPQTFRKDFLEILDFIVFQSALNPRFYLFQQMISELKRADEATESLPYLENLRLYLKTRSLFRRHLYAALLHVRVQSFILCLLYSGLLFLVLYQYGWKYSKILLLSFTLFTVGLISLFRLGRRLKWTV